MKNENQRRVLLQRVLMGTLVVPIVLPTKWSKPIVNAVLLPAHAQMSTAMCNANLTRQGPIEGNPYGATNCTDACNGSAMQEDAKLCSVESRIIAGKEECFCHMDTTQPFGS
jgi:hypothetical protein